MTLARGLAILTTLAQSGADGLAIGDVCRITALPRVSAHRLLAGLIRAGWIEQDDERRYRLGIAAWQLGLAAQSQFDLIRIADPSLDAIERDTQDTTFLLKRVGGDALCVARREGTYPVKLLVMDVGVSYPLGVGAATLAILAHLGEEEYECALRETESRLKAFPRISPATIRVMAAETRRRGFAFSSGFIVPEACAAAVPIFDAARRPIGSFACVASADRLKGERLDLVARTLIREAERVSARLGSTQPRAASGRPKTRPSRPASRSSRASGSHYA